MTDKQIDRLERLRVEGREEKRKEWKRKGKRE